MSLKSFDKFCERMILSEPGSQKEIFDERQKIVRSRITIEALLIFGCSAILNCMIMEECYKWAESQLAAMALLVSACLLYWQVRCAAKGCMIGTNGKFTQTFSGVYIIFMGVLGILRFIDKFGEPDFVIKDGALSKEFIGIVVMLIFLVVGIFTLCVVRHENKREERSEEKK
ncbi:MAG: hypothetical protein K2N38_11940 [Oscillospiraceae bacterium]|nr:hypothetical protein [Oscillospiraceae bacterium]